MPNHSNCSHELPSPLLYCSLQLVSEPVSAGGPLPALLPCPAYWDAPGLRLGGIPETDPLLVPREEAPRPTPLTETQPLSYCPHLSRGRQGGVSALDPRRLSTKHGSQDRKLPRLATGPAMEEAPTKGRVAFLSLAQQSIGYQETKPQRQK